MRKTRGLTYIDTYKGYEFYKFKPKPWKLFWKNLEKMTFVRFFRFTREFLDGYKIYYMFSDTEPVGYCLISKGGGRYKFTSSKDIYTGPYYIAPSHRGKHLSELMMSHLLFDILKNTFSIGYATVSRNNIPSCKCLEKIGYKQVRGKSVKHSGLLQNVIVQNNESGSYIYEFHPNGI